MHGYTGKDLGRAFRTVRDNTIQIAEEIPDDQYGFRPAEGSQSVAETLAHIAVVPQMQMRIHSDRMTELTPEFFQTNMPLVMAEAAQLTTKFDIVPALHNEGEAFATFLEHLPDEALAEEVHFLAPIQPNVKTRFEMLLSVKEHEMHHRAQLMVIERMLGLVPHLTRRMQERMAQMTQQQGGAQGA
ncbi:MAG: DinB family protein [Bryobacteraceae bacterium]